MSEVPSGWVKIALGDAIQIQKGKKPIGLGPKSEDRTVPYINISAFETKWVEEYAPGQDVPECEPSDTLLVWDGARAGLAGRGIGGFIGSTLARLKSDLADPAYLFYFIRSNYGYLNTHTKGVGIPHIDPVVLAEISFPLPPSAEQTRIVEKLEELLSDLDAGVAELKAAQKKLTQYRQSLLKAAVEGVLTAEWRKHNTPQESGAKLLQRILTERRTRWEARQLAKFQEQGKPPPKDWKKKYPEPVQPDTTDLPELPEGWVWASVEQLSCVVRGASPRPAGDLRFFGGEIPWITVGSLTADESMFLNAVSQFVTEAGKDASRFIEVGTLLLTNSGATLGVPKITNIGGCINDGLVALLDVDEPLKVYLYWYLSTQTDVLRATNQGAAQPNLNTDIVKRICVPIFPIAEMERINDLLNNQTDAIEEQRNSIAIALKKINVQRQNILRAAFSGQLVQQDPNDEPAILLLERIRAERAAREKQPKARKTKQQKEIATVVDKRREALP